MARAWRIVWLGLAGMLLCLAPAARAHGHHPAAQLPVVVVADLPAEARETLRLIKQGGPFPYARDGVVFSNYEHVLPRHGRGYYREYTVKTPGMHGRGPRRIVCGPWPECYYSDDHYQTFRHIAGEQ